MFTMSSQSVTFLPTTWLSMLDKLEDNYIELELNRFRHLLPDKVYKTRSSDSISSKRDLLRNLLQKSCWDMLNAKVSEAQRIQNSITLLAKKFDEHLNLCRSTPEEQGHDEHLNLCRSTPEEQGHDEHLNLCRSTPEEQGHDEHLNLCRSTPEEQGHDEHLNLCRSTPEEQGHDEHLNLCRSTPEEQGHVFSNVMQHEASCTPDALTPINTIPVDLKTSDTVDKLPAPIETHIQSAADISLDSILSTTNFTKIGNREICYFGDLPFGYGKNRLDANPYPSKIPDFLHKVRDSIRALDKDFSFQSYSCMIERYGNGLSTFPHHTDPENCIDSTSKIYNVSVGAARDLEFLNLTGPLSPIRVTVSNGDIYSMQAASQGLWSRSMVPDASIKDPRVSITFTKVCIPSPHIIPPPLGLPGCNVNIKRDILMQKHKYAQSTATTRTLFLTDSMLGNIFPSSLRASSRDICIKKTLFYLTEFSNYVTILLFYLTEFSNYVTILLFYLTEFSNYEQEFEYCKRVIVSCGVNDITRRYLSPEVISDILLPQIKGLVSYILKPLLFSIQYC